MKTIITGCILFLTCFSSFAKDINLTIYDDGMSCPGDCDSHVVFDKTLNGTEFAHTPTSNKQPFELCKNGTKCKICLTSGLKQCLEVMYRGNGPPPNTFDFTPAFYIENCPAPDTLPLLQNKCSELEAAGKSLDGTINCFKNTDNVTCKKIMSEAQKAKEEDQPLYDACRNDGETKFNKSQPKEKQRTSLCAYEKYGTGGPNSKGQTWKRLLPAACRPGTYVGRDGLDCCRGTPFIDGPLGIECRNFYISK